MMCPCKDCQARCEHCHANCQKYAAYRQQFDQAQMLKRLHEQTSYYLGMNRYKRSESMKG